MMAMLFIILSRTKLLDRLYGQFRHNINVSMPWLLWLFFLCCISQSPTRSCKHLLSLILVLFQFHYYLLLFRFLSIISRVVHYLCCLGRNLIVSYCSNRIVSWSSSLLLSNQAKVISYFWMKYYYYNTYLNIFCLISIVCFRLFK